MRPPFEMSTAKNAVMSATRIACCMLWVTRAMVLALELEHQFLNAPRGDRVEGRARLVHEQHRRLRCDRARNAQALLLAAPMVDKPLALSLSFTSSQSAARRSACSTRSSNLPL